jgi:predicted porin
MTIRSVRSALVSLVTLCTLAGPASAQDRIDALIERVERQEQEIRALREQVKQLTEHGAPPPEHPEYRREDGDYPLADYENPAIRLDIAGQVNAASNVGADGKETKLYFVDNDTSASRIRFAGVAIFDEGPQVGSTLEVGFSPNNSFDVSQDRETAGDFISVRRAELWGRADRLGRVMFGRGSAAADNIADFDLSLVSGPIMTSGVSFAYGGLQFTDGRDLTGITIADTFFNFSGNRQNRIRYDTPMLGPVQLSVSAGADQRYDAAITFGGDYDHWTGFEIGPFTGLGGIAISQPNVDDVDYRVAGSYSMLHDPTGLSLTFSGGFDAGTPGGTPYSVYGKLAWDTQIVRFGPTGFGVDYGWTENYDDPGNEGQSAGLAAVQVLQRYGIELYGQVRWFQLDREQRPSLDDMYLGTLGTRIRF